MSYLADGVIYIYIYISCVHPIRYCRNTHTHIYIYIYAYLYMCVSKVISMWTDVCICIYTHAHIWWYIKDKRNERNMYCLAMTTKGFESFMMTSSNGNISRVTGPLWGEFTGPWWISLTKASDAELWCLFFICARINHWVKNREAGDLRRHRAHYDDTVMLWPEPVLVTHIWSVDWVLQDVDNVLRSGRHQGIPCCFHLGP